MAGLFDTFDTGDQGSGILPPQPGAGQGFMPRIASALNNPLTMFGLALASGKTPQEGFGNAVNSQLAQQKIAQANLTGDIKEFQFAKLTGAIPKDMSFVDYQKQAANLKDRENFGLNPVYYYDAEGKLRLGQPSNRGNFKPMDIPGSATDRMNTIQTPTDIIRAPVHGIPGAVPGGAPSGVGQPTTSATDDMGRPVTQEPAGPILNPSPSFPGATSIPKDNLKAAQDKKLGTDTATAIERLPAIETTTKRAIERLNILENHPGIDAATGFIAGKSPIALTPSARDFIARVDEVQGESWTQGIETMRGLGALSDAEGRRIEQARSRLSARDVNTSDYKKAIQDVKDIMQTGLNNARKIATGKMKPYPVGQEDQSAPDSGDAAWTTLPNGIRIRQK